MTTLELDVGDIRCPYLIRNPYLLSFQEIGVHRMLLVRNAGPVPGIYRPQSCLMHDSPDLLARHSLAVLPEFKSNFSIAVERDVA